MSWDQCYLGRVLINAQIAALLVAEFFQESPDLSKKQQLTGLFCERDARNGRGGFVTEGLAATASRESKPAGADISAS